MDRIEFKKGFNAFNRGGAYPEDQDKRGPFRDGWDAACHQHCEDIFDSADQAFAQMNPHSDY